MKTFTSRSIAVVAAILATAVNVAAVAPAQAQVRETVVVYKDLNLGTAAGMATLKARIRIAAHAVCPDADRVGTRIQGSCYGDAVKGAMAKLPVQTQVASR